MTTSSLPYADFSRQIRALSAPPIRRPATAEKLRQVLAEFGEICLTTADVTPVAIATWLGSRPGRASLTSFSLLRSFATATRAATKLGLLERDPFAFRPPSQWFQTGALDAPERSRHHSAAQIVAVLQRASQDAIGGGWVAVRDEALVCFCCFLGLRAREALGLLVRDVDLANRLVHVRPNAWRPLKTRASRRLLAIPEALYPVARDYVPRCGSRIHLFPHKGLDGPWFHGRPGHKPLDRVRALGARVGIEGLTILSLRHSFATMVEELYSELQLQRVLGHRRPKTQQGYRHEDLGQLRRAAELVRY